MQIFGRDEGNVSHFKRITIEPVTGLEMTIPCSVLIRSRIYGIIPSLRLLSNGISMVSTPSAINREENPYKLDNSLTCPSYLHVEHCIVVKKNKKVGATTKEQQQRTSTVLERSLQGERNAYHS